MYTRTKYNTCVHILPISFSIHFHAVLLNCNNFQHHLQHQNLLQPNKEQRLLVQVTNRFIILHELHIRDTCTSAAELLHLDQRASVIEVPADCITAILVQAKSVFILSTSCKPQSAVIHLVNQLFRRFYTCQQSALRA